MLGMVHQGQSLTFRVEPRQHRSRIHPCLDQLDRHLATDRLGLARQKNCAHAPLADLLDQRVPPGDDRTDPLARRDRCRAGH